MSRRKYKTPQGYKDGGRVPVSDMAIPDAATPEPAPPQTGSDGDDALVRAAAATRRADELQRAPPQDTLETYIAGLPVSDHKKDFLRQWPQMLQAGNAKIIHRAYVSAREAGIPEDTAEMDRFLLEEVNRSARAQQHRGVNDAISATPLNVVPSRPLGSIDEEADRLDAEARGYAAQAAAMDSIPSEIAANVPPAPKPQSGIPFSAPVSRGSPDVSTGRSQTDSGKITLSAEEREIARKSFTDPNMSDQQKELLYARNKRRLRQMRANGEYPMPERN